MDQIKPNFAIPVAIIIAGVAIAVGIYFSGQARPAPVATQNTAPTTTQNNYSDIVVPAITSTDHILASPNASIVVVEYSDLECPYCKIFHGTMHKIIDMYGKDGKVAWVYRNMPLDQLHPLARGEAEASECAASLGGNDIYWKYIDQIFATTPSNNQLNQSLLPTFAQKLGINVTQFNTCVSNKTFVAKVQQEYEDGYIATGGRPGTPFNIVVLREAMSQAVQSKILSIFGQATDVLRISNDSKRIAISGALPFDAMKMVIDTLLGK